MSGITVRTALACEDIRTENSGKLLAIGIINPILGLGSRLTVPGRPALRLHFLLSLDVPEAGEHLLTFRVRGLRNLRGQMVKMRVEFNETAKHIPFPVGPLVLPLVDDENGFKLQQLVEDRWKIIATWRFEDSPGLS